MPVAADGSPSTPAPSPPLSLALVARPDSSSAPDSEQQISCGCQSPLRPLPSSLPSFSTSLLSIARAFGGRGQPIGALAVMIACNRSPNARSVSGIAAIFASTALSPSALSGRVPERAVAFVADGLALPLAFRVSLAIASCTFDIFYGVESRLGSKKCVNPRRDLIGSRV